MVLVLMKSTFEEKMVLMFEIKVSPRKVCFKYLIIGNKIKKYLCSRRSIVRFLETYCALIFSELFIEQYFVVCQITKRVRHKSDGHLSSPYTVNIN